MPATRTLRFASFAGLAAAAGASVALLTGCGRDPSVQVTHPDATPVVVPVNQSSAAKHPRRIGQPEPATVVAVRGSTVDLAAGGGPAARLLSVDRGSVVEQRLVPAGAAAKPRVLLPARTALGYASAAAMPGGAAVATDVRTGARQVLRAADRRPGGAITPPQTISEPGVRVRSVEIDIGPTGAVAIPFREEPGHHERLAFRPAGATRFGSAIKLKPDSDNSNTAFQVVLGPDGGGALLGLNGTQRPNFVERISPSGMIGPAIPIQTGLSGTPYGVAAFAPDGTLAVAIAIDASTGLQGDPNPSGVFVTTLPAGASHFSPVLRLGPGGSTLAGADDLAMTISPKGHHITLLIGSVSHHLHVYEGDGRHWTHTAAFPTPFAFDAQLLLATDGGMTAIWDDAVPGGSSSGEPRTAIFASHRVPGGAFDPPHAITTAGTGGASPGRALALGGGKIAFSYTRYPGQSSGISYAAVATP